MARLMDSDLIKLFSFWGVRCFDIEGVVGAKSAGPTNL